MFIMDDILLRQLGISIPGIDTLWTIEQIKNFAHKELYNPEKIKSKIKENRMLFEFGEITSEEYERTNAELMRKLRQAEQGEEMNLEVRTDILGAR
ncbi:MAG: gas vesicle protein GvpG [Euryarchaeota archaeon]|nr:gas vesicle protein GvpG [Euryarchaeota archaeon]MBU4340231.1 gas vesicle protein GvpG [Euryarchaeota archaeon]MCG2735911.1 gas vesicle protein GvpG [Candidatus Methanoperedenaceae archaeon]MDO9097672.1 gas vesicle protein GvpG [Candidatus Methanoperedens sp.]